MDRAVAGENLEDDELLRPLALKFGERSELTAIFSSPFDYKTRLSQEQIEQLSTTVLVKLCSQGRRQKEQNHGKC